MYIEYVLQHKVTSVWQWVRYAWTWFVYSHCININITEFKKKTLVCMYLVPEIVVWYNRAVLSSCAGLNQSTLIHMVIDAASYHWLAYGWLSCGDSCIFGNVYSFTRNSCGNWSCYHVQSWSILQTALPLINSSFCLPLKLILLVNWMASHATTSKDLHSHLLMIVRIAVEQ